MLKTKEHVIMTVDDFMSMVCRMQQYVVNYARKAREANNVEMKIECDGMAMAFWIASECMMQNLMGAVEVEDGGFILDAAINAVKE